MSEDSKSQPKSVRLADLSDEQQASVIANHHAHGAGCVRAVEDCVSALNKALADAATAGLSAHGARFEVFVPERHFVGCRSRVVVKIDGLYWSVP